MKSPIRSTPRRDGNRRATEGHLASNACGGRGRRYMALIAVQCRPSGSPIDVFIIHVARAPAPPFLTPVPGSYECICFHGASCLQRVRVVQPTDARTARWRWRGGGGQCR